MRAGGRMSERTDVRTYGQRDREAYMMKLIVTFRNFANETKKWEKLIVSRVGMAILFVSHKFSVSATLLWSKTDTTEAVTLSVKSP